MERALATHFARPSFAPWSAFHIASTLNFMGRVGWEYVKSKVEHDSKHILAIPEERWPGAHPLTIRHP